MTWQLGSRPVSDVQHLKAPAKHRNPLYQRLSKTEDDSPFLDVHSHKLKDIQRRIDSDEAAVPMAFFSSVFSSAQLRWHLCFPT